MYIKEMQRRWITKHVIKLNKLVRNPQYELNGLFVLII